MNRTNCWVVFILSLFLSAATDAQPSAKNPNEEVVLAMNALFNTNQPEAAMQYYADTLVNKGSLNGMSFFRAMHDDILQTFPDNQTRITQIYSDQDWVIAACVFQGTHSGTARLPHHGGLLIGKEPTGKKFAVQHIRMYRVVGGRIVERRAVRDDLAMYQQLGLLPVATFKPGKP